MNRTKVQIVEQMRVEMPYHLPKRIKPYIFEAMKIYAQQEALSFANWLSYKTVTKETTEQLYKQYLEEIGKDFDE